MKYIFGIALIIFTLILTHPKPGYSQAFSALDSNFDTLTNEEIGELALYQGSSIGSLYNSLLVYRKTAGVFPETMREFVDSGFPIFWPVDLYSGKSMYIIDTIPENPDKSYLGAFTYSLDFDTAVLSYVNYSYNSLKIDNEKILKVYSMTIPNSLSYSKTEFGEWPNHMIPEGMESQPLSTLDAISVTQGTMKIDDVDDYSTRVLYAFCGQITNFLESKFRNYYFDKGEFPPTVSDLFRHTGAGSQIIIDNFNYFTELLKKANADFRCGFDSKANTAYLYLEINDVKYITYCEKYGDSPLHPLMNECDVDNLDMSNPLISTDNLSEIQIPYEYIISIRDIPAGI